MKKIKQIICILLAIAMAAALIACGTGTPDASENVASPGPTTGSQSSPAPTTGGQTSPGVGAPTTPTFTPAEEGTKYAEELTIILDANRITTLDHGNAANATVATGWAWILIRDTLVRLSNDASTIEPMLAKSWETDDYQHFTFHLRDDVYFSNGERFTAEDVVYTINRAKESLGANVYDYYSPVMSMNIVDDFTVELELEAVSVDFLDIISSSHCSILNKKAMEEDPVKGSLIGTGAYTVEQFVPDEYCVFAANENYWGGAPTTKKLTLRYLAEQSARLLALESGEAQVAGGLNTAEYSYVDSNPDLDFISYPMEANMPVGYNMTDPLTGDINFRWAVAHAVRRDEIIAAARTGWGIAPPDGSFWGWATEYRNTSIPLPVYDQDLAKEYLAKSVYNGEDVEIVAAFDDIIAASQALQQQLKEIGINAELFVTDIGGLMQHCLYADNKSQLRIMGGPFSRIPSSINNYVYPGAFGNMSSYNKDEVTQLLDAAFSNTNIAEREAQYKEVQRIVAEDIPYVPLYYMVQGLAVKKGVEGMVLRSSDAHDLRYIRMAVN